MNTRSLLAKKSITRIAFWSFVILVLYATLTPLDGIKININFELISIDKVIHLVIFLLLAVLLYFAYPKIGFIWIFATLSLYGLLIEVLQQVLPLGRSFEWMDWIYDMLGTGFGILIIEILRKTSTNRI